jgi:hypothetical protein
MRGRTQPGERKGRRSSFLSDSPDGPLSGLEWQRGLMYQRERVLWIVPRITECSARARLATRNVLHFSDLNVEVINPPTHGLNQSLNERWEYCCEMQFKNCAA